MKVPRLSQAELALVNGILHQVLPPGSHVWVFGSRAGGSPKEFSDLDLLIDAGRMLSLTETASLAEAFSESDLPWKVDVADKHAISPAFWRAIQRDCLLLG